MRVLVFPGQGSQKIGMGFSFYKEFEEARDVFHEVDETLKFKLSHLIFNGDQKELSQTINAQPALMVTSMAILRVIEKLTSKKINFLSEFVCGHSLGEFTALCAAGVISLHETARLLQIRGKSMQNAVPEGKGAMAALLSSDFSKLNLLLNEVSKIGLCQIANDNSNEQKVVSGEKLAVEKLVKISSNFDIKRSIMLNVSAPFHCNLMSPAQARLEEELENVNFSKPLLPIICNYTAQIEENPNKLKRNIINQVTSMVRWRETMDLVCQKKINEIVEVGAGKVLTGISKRFSSKIDCYNVETKVNLEDYISKLGD